MLALATLLPLLALVNASPTPLSKRYTSVKIRSGSTGQCLTTEPKTGSGSRVFTTDCADALLWTINPGSGSVLVGDGSVPLALDAGSNPGDGGKLKVWDSYPGLYQQTWYLTDDRRIAITGGNQCLDSGNEGQTWQCFPNNDNQVWYIDGEGSDPTPSSSSGPSQPSTTSSPSDPYDIARGNVYADPADGGGRFIRLGGRNDLCVSVQHGFNGLGEKVAVSSCFRADGTFVDQQLWDLPDGQGQIKLHSNNDLCLDAGSDPANGVDMKIYTCYDVPQQQWNFVDGTLRVNANNQCLDVKKESTPSYNKPYVWLRELQTWACDSQDPYQHFQLYDGPDDLIY